MNQAAANELLVRNKALEKENELLRVANQKIQKRIMALQVILDNAPAPIYLKDAEGEYIFVNRKYEYLSDVTLESIRGKTDFDIFSASVAELFHRQDEQVKQQKAPQEFEETVGLIDGKHTFITLKFPVTDSQGQIDAIGGFCTDITERAEFEKEKECLIQDLRKALDEVTVLRGILPICASCKSIRDDKGYWNKIEAYLDKHSDVKLSHSLCPSCMKKKFGKEKWYQDKYGVENKK